MRPESTPEKTNQTGGEVVGACAECRLPSMRVPRVNRRATFPPTLFAKRRSGSYTEFSPSASTIHCYRAIEPILQA
jgi:hypothetical protein